jgi:hypothetical protein
MPCPLCGSSATALFTNVDCSNKKCVNWKEPTKEDFKKLLKEILDKGYHASNTNYEYCFYCDRIQWNKKEHKKECLYIKIERSLSV